MILAYAVATHKLFSVERPEKLRGNMKKISKEFFNTHLLLIGLAGVLLSLIPYLLLGEDSIIPYHDQLDGELLAYLYQAKYLFSGSSVIPEFLGGAAKTALVPPAPLAVLLFKVFPPFAALVFMQAVGQVVGYIGMFRLSERVTDKKIVSFAAALLYAFLPFLPVYGLSQYGMPILLHCALHLYRGEKRKRSLCYVVLYAAMSSLVLCGFAWLAIWGLALAYLIIRKRAGAHRWFGIGFVALLAVYTAENLSLIGQMLGTVKSYTSHKSEYVLAGGGFLPTFWSYLLHNSEHSEDNHIWIGCLALVVIILFCLCKKKWTEHVKKQCKAMLRLLCTIGGLCVVAAFWDWAGLAAIKEKLGTIGTLQVDRVLWLTPMLWVLVLVFCLDILWSIRSCMKWLVYAASLGLLGLVGAVTLKNSLVKPCLQKVLRPNYHAISYADYLAIGVLEQVENYIAENEGLSKEKYRVASLGIDPAAALYHGFYTVDGYSNNYNLEYKHAFRRVIAPELEKSEYLREYFDYWGNRCYLFSAECPGYYTVEKGGFVFQNLMLDTAALKELGCKYVFSAAYIMNSEELGFTLLREEAFEIPDSYYRIFLYKLN